MVLPPGAPASVSAFIDSLASNRISLSLGFQNAIAGIREAYRAQAPYINAVNASSAAGAVGGVAQIEAEREVERWTSYKKMHMAIAFQGAMLLFNTIDLALKAYSRIQYGD